MKRKLILSAGMAALVAALSVAGTMAWLTDTTEKVENTFTVGKVGISLTETFNADTDGDGNPDAWAVKMIPGTTYAKDPRVAVNEASENCWLFIRIAKNDIGEALDYAVSDGWTRVEEHSGFYYRENVPASAQYDILAGSEGYANGCVTIKDAVTDETAPATLTISAAAVQYENVPTLAAAWDKLPDGFKA